MKLFAHSLMVSVVFCLLVCCTPTLFAGDGIPKAAWKRGIGQPLENAGGRKPRWPHPE